MRALVIVLLLMPSLGCATHAHRLVQIRSAYYEGGLGTAETLIDEGLKKDRFHGDVLQLDRALVQLCDGRAAEAEQTLRKVRDHFDRFEEKSAAETALSYLTDDNRRAYAGEDYERILIRAMLAMSNLMHSGDDAEAYSLQLAEIQERIIERGKTAKGENPKANYQRVAFGPYLRGVLREASHNAYDDAQRSYEAVVSWQPEFVPGKFDLQRAAHGTHSSPGNGVVYVFALVGRGPYKEQVAEVPSSASLLIAGEILSAAGKQTVPPNVAAIQVPRVVAQRNEIRSVHIGANRTSLGETQTITDVTRLAIAQYDAVFPQVVARAVARRCVKKGVIYGTKEMTGMEKGSLPGLALDLAGVAWEATETADTRCWGLLPEKIQVLRAELPKGTHELSFQAVAHSGAHSPHVVRQAITVADGSNTYVLVNFPGPQLVGRVSSAQR